MDSGYDGFGSLPELTEVPGKGMGVLQNSQKFRVRYESFTELTEVPGRYTNVVPLPPDIMAQAYRTYRSFGYGYECRPELTEVPGTGMDLVQNSQKFRVRVVPGKIPVSRGRKNYDNW